MISISWILTGARPEFLRSAMARTKGIDRQAIYLNFVKYCRPGSEGLPDFVAVSKKSGGLNAVKKGEWGFPPPIDKTELKKRATALSEKYLINEKALLELLL